MSAATETSTEEMLAEYARTGDSQTRDRIIERHEALVRSLAHKFARPGVPLEDLMQQAWIALIGAVDRWDASRQNRFSTYAVTCMVGEIKRYFRDRTWMLKVPRDLVEIATRLEKVQGSLQERLQRKPTIADLAEELGATEERVLEAMELQYAYQPAPLDQGKEGSDGGESYSLAETIGRPDDALKSLVDSAGLQEAISTLEERLQTILKRRFFEEWTQQQVAEELGVSQMHVSRLERSALQQLREKLRDLR